MSQNTDNLIVTHVLAVEIQVITTCKIQWNPDMTFTFTTFNFGIIYSVYIEY